MSKINRNSIILLLIIIYTVASSLFLLNYRSNIAAINCLVAGLIMFFNYLAITMLWRIVFNKKSIALAVFTIIFKYLILGFILWNLSSWMQIDSVGLIVGFSTLLFAVLTTTLVNFFRN